MVCLTKPSARNPFQSVDRALFLFAMDPDGNLLKGIALADTALNFDKHELETEFKHLSEEISKWNDKVLREQQRDSELKSTVESQSRYLASVKNSTVLIKESKASLQKEKAALLKQLELQRNKNENEKKQNEATLAKYLAMYEQSLSRFEDKPLVKKKKEVENDVKKLEIDLKVKEKELCSLKENLGQFVAINDRIFEISFIKLAEAWTSMKRESVRNEQLRLKEKELMEVASCIREPQKPVSSLLSFVAAPTSVIQSDGTISIENLSISFTSSKSTNLSMLKELRQELDTPFILSPQRRTDSYIFRRSQKNASLGNSVYVNNPPNKFNQSRRSDETLSICDSPIKSYKGSDCKTSAQKSSQIPVLNKVNMKRKSSEILCAEAGGSVSPITKPINVSNNPNLSKLPKFSSPRKSKIPVSCNSYQNKSDNSRFDRSISMTQPVTKVHPSANSTFELQKMSDLQSHEAIMDEGVQNDGEYTVSNQTESIQNRRNILNQTFSIQNEEVDSLVQCGVVSEKNVSGQWSQGNIEELEVPGQCLVSSPDPKQSMEITSKYFQDSYPGKENFAPFTNNPGDQLPPYDCTSLKDSRGEDACSKAGDDPLQQLETSYNYTPFSPPFSPAQSMSSSSPKTGGDPDIDNFFSGLGNQRTSLPQSNTQQKQSDDLSAKGFSNFSFQSKPKPPSGINFFKLF